MDGLLCGEQLCRQSGGLGHRRAPLQPGPPGLAAGDLQAADPVEAGLPVVMQLLVHPGAETGQFGEHRRLTQDADEPRCVTGRADQSVGRAALEHRHLDLTGRGELGRDR